jgi:hypothetical protein
VTDRLPAAKRAHNSIFPADFRFKGAAYLGPTDLFKSIRPKPNVVLNTFVSRLRRLRQHGAMTNEAIREALYLPPEDYQKKYGVRKTWVDISGTGLDLESFYRGEASRAGVSYRTFWSRVRSVKARELLDWATLEHALTLSGPDWISFYGGGRHRRFVYEGELCPEHRGRSFHGISAFLKTLGRYSEKSAIWSRLTPSFRESLELVRKDRSQPWGPANFEWTTTQRKVERMHGKPLRIWGVDYPSLKAVAEG